MCWHFVCMCHSFDLHVPRASNCTNQCLLHRLGVVMDIPNVCVYHCGPLFIGLIEIQHEKVYMYWFYQLSHRLIDLNTFICFFLLLIVIWPGLVCIQSTHGLQQIYHNSQSVTKQQKPNELAKFNLNILKVELQWHKIKIDMKHLCYSYHPDPNNASQIAGHVSVSGALPHTPELGGQGALQPSSCSLLA